LALLLRTVIGDNFYKEDLFIMKKLLLFVIIITCSLVAVNTQAGEPNWEDKGMTPLEIAKLIDPCDVAISLIAVSLAAHERKTCQKNAKNEWLQCVKNPRKWGACYSSWCTSFEKCEKKFEEELDALSKGTRK
jgi:hypothetical protein